MVRVLKLITGETIIANIKDDHQSLYEVENPILLIMAPGPGDSAGIAMMPYCPFTDKPITISKNHVLFVAEPNMEISNHYNAQFGSGIVTAPTAALNQINASQMQAN